MNKPYWPGQVAASPAEPPNEPPRVMPGRGSLRDVTSTYVGPVVSRILWLKSWDKVLTRTGQTTFVVNASIGGVWILWRLGRDIFCSTGILIHKRLVWFGWYPVKNLANWLTYRYSDIQAKRKILPTQPTNPVLKLLDYSPISFGTLALKMTTGNRQLQQPALLIAGRCWSALRNLSLLRIYSFW